MRAGHKTSAATRARLSEALKRHYATKPPRPDQAERDAARFWAKVDRRGPDECWLWKGPKIRRTEHYSQGHFYLRGRSVLAHRYALWGNEGPADMVAMHRCDVPLCCNPAHLVPGTQLQNNADMLAKGRTARGTKSGAHTKPERRRRGTDHGQSKLTDADVLEIRRRVAAGERRVVVAADFGIHVRNVSRIVSGEAWSHLK